MMGAHHAMTGAAAWIAVTATAGHGLGLFPVSPSGTITGALLCAGAALLADADHGSATISRSVPVLGRLVTGGISRASGGHRHGLHGLLAVLCAWLLATGLDRLSWQSPWAEKPIDVGVAAASAAAIAFAGYALGLAQGSWLIAWLIGLVGAPLGFLWVVVGIALLASVFLFVKAAGEAALVRPALVLTGTPKWDGTRRTAWSIESDDLPESLKKLAAGLDAELGDSLTAYDQGDDFHGITRTEAFGSPTHPVLFAWGVGGKPRLAAREDVDGVWIRMEYNTADALVATVLANEGRAVDALTQVAWRA